MKASPVEGYTVHVLAPHRVEGNRWAPITIIAVSTTDGLIVHFYYDGNSPNGRTSVTQAVGHKPMKEAEFKNQAAN